MCKKATSVLPNVVKCRSGGGVTWKIITWEIEEDSELPKVLLKVLFWALLKVLLLGKVLFKVLKKVLEIVQYPKKC